MATETLCSIAACCTTLSASAVFPIDGRAARMIKSPRWNPAVRRSRSVKPLATPVSAPCVVWSCSIRSIVGQISSFSRMNSSARLSWATWKTRCSALSSRSAEVVRPSYASWMIAVAASISRRSTALSRTMRAW